MTARKQIADYPDLPSGATIGQYYRSRFGYQELEARNTVQVANHLITWPRGLLKGKLYELGELPLIGHELTMECLERAVELMYDRVVKYAGVIGIPSFPSWAPSRTTV